MSALTSYRKRPLYGDLKDWVEREFEEVERVLASELTCYRWDDLNFPPQGIKAGGTGEPTVDTDGTLIFSASANQAVAVITQMPHAWVDGTAIRPHIHLQAKTSTSAPNNVSRWKLEWDIASVNGDFGTLASSETVSFTNPANVNKHAIKAWAEIAMPSMRDSAIIKFKITRLAAAAGAGGDALDTDTAAINLLAFDVHYQRNSQGSFDEYPS